MSAAILQAVRIWPWGAGATPISVTNASSSAADLTGSKGQGVLIICTVPFHMRWGASSVGAATTNDLLIPANTLLRVDVPSSSSDFAYFRVIREGASDGTLYYATIEG